MPQKKLQLKTVAANMCGLQPGKSGLIQFVKQQSQSIAVSYTLALVLFLSVGSFQWLVFYSRSNSSPDYPSKGPSSGILLQSKMFVFYFRHLATNRIITGRSMKNNTPAAVDFQDLVKLHWSEHFYSEKIAHRLSLLNSWRWPHLTGIPTWGLVDYSIFKDQQRFSN